MTDFSDERIRAMLRGRREVRVLPMPGTEEGAGDTVGVRVLLEQEVDEARLEALQYVNGMAKRYRLDARDMLSIDGELLDREIERQLVFRAFVDPDKPAEGDYKHFFGAPQAVRQLDTVLQRTLFHLYIDHQNYVSPLRGLDETEVQELAEALGKGRNAKATLALYDAPSLRSLVHILAARLATAPSGRSSTGTEVGAG
jgi:hypothetical protein